MYRLKPNYSQEKKQEAQDGKCGEKVVKSKHRVHSMTMGNIRIYSSSKVNKSHFDGLIEKIREV